MSKVVVFICFECNILGYYYTGYTGFYEAECDYHGMTHRVKGSYDSNAGLLLITQGDETLPISSAHSNLFRVVTHINRLDRFTLLTTEQRG